MTDRSKWFIYKHGEDKFGCFRLRPFNNHECAKAMSLLEVRKNVLKMSDAKYARECAKIIAHHVIQDWEDVWLEFADKSQSNTNKYTPNNAYRMMTESSIGPKLAIWIIEKSKSISV